MGVEQRFLKKNSDKIPPGEQVLGVVLAEPKGAAWRRGMNQAGALTSVVAAATKMGQMDAAHSGDVAVWPEALAFWIVLTDKQMHVFGGRVGSDQIDPNGAQYPYDRIAKIEIDKKLLISKLNIAFKDGTSIELGLAKQKLQPFVDAAQARVAST
ncbi:MAG TPA: hypothetical protein VNC78_07965 [Actinomycetota bacterium]|nr:hypothetical protein [Actinomycetota bacterium]